MRHFRAKIYKSVTVVIGIAASINGITGAYAADDVVDVVVDSKHIIDGSEFDKIPHTSKERQRIENATALTSDFSKAEKFEVNPAGAATVRRRKTRDAFSDPSGNISFDRELDFKVGNGLFKKLWVSAPASTKVSDGLGPLFNSRSCQTCHIKDGRGHPPENETDSRVSMLFGLYQVQKTTAHMQGHYYDLAGDPVYGHQMQDLSNQTIAAEGKLSVTYQEKKVILNGGETVFLRQPTYKITQENYGEIDPKTVLSPRVAPQMIGMGLLEAIPALDILKNADPFDKNRDGISGQARLLKSETAPNSEWILGRFGLKAGSPSVQAQTAKALFNDMGLSTLRHHAGYGDCTSYQTDCRQAPDGGDIETEGVEVGAEALRLMTFYSQNLAVPARTNIEAPNVLKGKEVFYDIGCASCHQPKFVTARIEGQPEQSFQLIWPYSDMLLHDMGPGLADRTQNGRATSAFAREWRTPPLWGIGLTQQVSGHTYFLHDGRARNLTEAIVWHGGEGEKAKQKFIALEPAQRQQLIAFLESL